MGCDAGQVEKREAAGAGERGGAAVLSKTKLVGAGIEQMSVWSPARNAP